MKKFIETLKNCWKVEDLRQRILITLLFTAIYRFGSFVVLPGINPGQLEKLQSQTAGGLMSLLDMFSGGAFSNASIFALGIMPYISASIVMQLLAIAVPYFQKMQREGESGRKKINWYTRLLTIGILLFQAPSYLINLKYQASQALASGISWEVFMIPATIILAAGSMFILWLGERITDKGIGNGVSIIIMIGIIARLPQAFAQEVGSRFQAITGGGLVTKNVNDVKEIVEKLVAAIEDLKKIVVAVKAAGQSTDNAVTAIKNAVRNSQNVVITNKLDDESVKQLKTKYDTYYQQEETLFKKHGIDISQMLERNKDRCYEIINHGDGVYFGRKTFMRLYIAFCIFFGIVLVEVIYGLLKLFGTS